MKLLLVDNEPNVLEVMQLGLSIQGYEVSTATNGSEALDTVKKEQFDIILLDLIMPEMDGIEVLKRMKKMGLRSKILMLSAYPSQEMVEESLEKGACGFIVKPSSAEEISSAIQQALDPDNKTST